MSLEQKTLCTDVEHNKKRRNQNAYPSTHSVDAETSDVAVACRQLIFAREKKRDELAAQMRFLLSCEGGVCSVMSSECRRQWRVIVERLNKRLFEELPCGTLVVARFFFFGKCEQFD